MKIVLYLLAAFVGFVVFAPNIRAEKIDNLPLLITILVCIVLYFIIKAIRRSMLLVKLKKLLISKGMKITRFSILPNLSGSSEKYDISASLGETKFNFQFLLRKKKHYRYHFENFNRLEYFKSNRLVFKHTSRGATITNAIETNSAGRRTLSFKGDNDAVEVLIIDKAPGRITDSIKKEDLYSGDRICNKVYYYELKSFVNKIDEFISNNTHF